MKAIFEKYKWIFAVCYCGALYFWFYPTFLFSILAIVWLGMDKLESMTRGDDE